MMKNEKIYRIEAYHELFDTACRDHSRAVEILDGWEHKERIRTVYVVFTEDQESVPEITMGSNDFPVFYNESDAEDYMMEEIMELLLA